MRANQIIALALLLIVLTSEVLDCCGRWDVVGRILGSLRIGGSSFR